MVSPTDFVIPPGSLVLVTAANSYIGAHVVDLLLVMGYKVRGTVRNFHKCRWLLDYFDNKYGKGAFELVVVEDMAAGGAYINAIKGVAGVVHVASPTQTALDPERVVPIAVNGVLEALNSAMNESNILRFVLTSSSVAVVEPAQAQKSIVTSDMWNEEAVEQVRAPSPHNQNRALAVYAASKVTSEQAMWEWMTNSRPSFTANSVIPSFVFGRPVSLIHQGHPSSSRVPIAIYNNDRAEMVAFIDSFPPFFFVDVEDVARLHVAALLLPDVEGERIFAFAGPFNRNDLVRSIRKLFPGRQLPEDTPGLATNESSIMPAGRAIGLLGKLWDKGFTGLDDSLKANLEEFL